MTTNNKYLVEEYRGRINRVMDHIERNMDRSFTLEELADIANFQSSISAGSSGPWQGKLPSDS